MSYLYDQYLERHRNGVKKAYRWIQENIPEVIPEDKTGAIEFAILNHDRTKNDIEEYGAYDDYFYKHKDNRSYEVVKCFNLAFLHHLHNNPHHWQYWILINDGQEEHEEIIFDMPYEYIIEMICDWWSFSWDCGNLFEIFNWYKDNSDRIKLSFQTKTIVDNILGLIQKELQEKTTESYLAPASNVDER